MHRNGTVLVSETFANGTTQKGDWIYSKGACLTAGSRPKGAGSIPPCPRFIVHDPPGQGALSFTNYAPEELNYVAWNAPLPTANGLAITYTIYDFTPGGPAADGQLMFLTDGAAKPPHHVSVGGGNLGYIDGPGGGGIPAAYLGVGFDEYGNFSASLPDGPGIVPETVAIAGAAAINWRYIGGFTNPSGSPSSLPFTIDQPGWTRPTGRTIDISLTPGGFLEVAIDIHDGNGPTTYLSESIVGVDGQPALPATAYVGFIGTTGSLEAFHQLNNLTISTLQ